MVKHIKHKLSVESGQHHIRYRLDIPVRASSEVRLSSALVVVVVVVVVVHFMHMRAKTIFGF